jgi:hypothetical protein
MNDLPTTDDLLTELINQFKTFTNAQEGKTRDSLTGMISMREVLAAKQKRECIEKLSGFYDSDASKKTVKELLTSTGSIALPTISSEIPLKT